MPLPAQLAHAKGAASGDVVVHMATVCCLQLLMQGLCSCTRQDLRLHSISCSHAEQSGMHVLLAVEVACA